MPLGLFATLPGQLPPVVAPRTDPQGRPIGLPERWPEQRAVLFTGTPGTGKSVELARAEADAIKGGTLVLRVAASGHEPVEARLARAVVQALPELPKQHGRAARKLKRLAKSMMPGMRMKSTNAEVRVGVPPLTVAGRHGEEHLGGSPAQLTELTDTLLEVLGRRELALMVDDVQLATDHDLMVLNDLARHVQQDGVVAHLVLAGNGQALGKLAAASRDTAGVDTDIGQLYEIRRCLPLQDAVARDVLRVPLAQAGVGVDEQALDKLVESAQGNPRRLQRLGAAAASLCGAGLTDRQLMVLNDLAGKVAWPRVLSEAVAKAAIDRVDDSTQSRLGYEAIWSRASGDQRDLLARVALRAPESLSMPSVSRAEGSDAWKAVEAARTELADRGILAEGATPDRVRFADPGLQRWISARVGPSIAHLGVSVLVRPGERIDTTTRAVPVRTKNQGKSVGR